MGLVHLSPTQPLSSQQRCPLCFGLTGVGGHPGRWWDPGAWEEGRSVVLFAVSALGGCGETFSPSDVATVLS